MSSTSDDVPDAHLTHPSEAIREVVSVLAGHGVASPRADAELLASYVLGVPRTRLLLAAGLSIAQHARLRELVAARAARVPLQHLTGTAPFRHLELAVGPGVFIPRPETELLVEWGRDRIVAAPPGRVVVDLCSGSGAIALAVASECPQVTVYAVEQDLAAGAWLRRNAGIRTAAGDRPIRVVPGDAGDPTVLSTLDGTVDLVLSNPPYVPATARVGMPVEVGRHDPYSAVFSGADGLDLIRRLVGRVALLLRPGGWFGVEHDESHALAVPALLGGDGRYGEITDHLDLAGRPRFATARRLADCTT